MGVSLDTKSSKKQPASLPRDSASQSFDRALMQLENICFEISHGDFTHGREDMDRIYWQQKLKNIAMPLSLALAEHKGPRVFHHHYKHDEKNADVLVPVMESARENLIKACERASHQCDDMTGMKGSKLLEERALLCKAIRAVLASA